MTAAKTSRDITAEVTFLTRALKAPTLRESVDRLAERARAENWTHVEFLVACLQREVAARDAHGGEGRIRTARFPGRKSLEEFDFDHALADAHHAGKLQAELVRLGRYPLLVVDEVGYIPFEPEAANLFFQLVSSRDERASLIVTSNKPFGRWGEVFGDDVVAAAMIDRLVHHAEVISLKGDSYRLKDRDLGRVPAAATSDE
jgi:DNA replication protein DnaC